MDGETIYGDVDARSGGAEAPGTLVIDAGGTSVSVNLSCVETMGDYLIGSFILDPTNHHDPQVTFGESQWQGVLFSAPITRSGFYGAKSIRYENGGFRIVFFSVNRAVAIGIGTGTYWIAEMYGAIDIEADDITVITRPPHAADCNEFEALSGKLSVTAYEPYDTAGPGWIEGAFSDVHCGVGFLSGTFAAATMAGNRVFWIALKA